MYFIQGKTNITNIYNNDIFEDSNYKWKHENLFSTLNSMNIKNTSVVSHWKGMFNLVQDSENIIYIKDKSEKNVMKSLLKKQLKK